MSPFQSDKPKPFPFPALRAASDWNAPLVGYTPKGPQNERIAALEPFLRRGPLQLNVGLPATFREQFADFPHCKHDDGLDALTGRL